MTKSKFINGVADESTIRTSDFLYKYSSEFNIWFLNRLSKTVDISEYKDEIINDIENKLTFNQWQAFLLLKGERNKAFELYCQSCNFSEEEKQMIIDIFKNS